jgi:hypothetical protein
MKTFRLGGVCIGGFSVLVLFGCGGVPAANVSGASLDGNWSIVGTGSLFSAPALSFSLIAEGNQLYGRGDVGVDCGTSGGGVGGSVDLTGTLASDGTFQLTQAAGTGETLDGSVLKVVVNGEISPGNAAWSGTYAMTSSGGSCPVNETGSFVATAFAPLTGTYAGQLVDDNTGAGGITASLSVTQGEATLLQTSLSTYYYLPVASTITVSGIPCFSKGTTMVAADGISLSGVGGYFVNLQYKMDDGSTLLGHAQLADTKDSAMQLQVSDVTGGACDGSYSGTVTPQ